MSVMDITKGITRGQVLRYVLLPQVFPRIHDFYRSGFSQLAYLIALVYQGVNILPANHKILEPRYRHRLSIRMVLGAAASELKFSRSHIDQIIVYFAILIGLFLLAGQFLLMLGYVMVNPALAGGMPTNYGDFFNTPQPATDVAYRLLWTVFGVPELFGAAGNGTRNQFHVAMHAMFQLYSVGLLVVGVIIACYFIFAIVVETAQTGVPFGKRYNHAWAPLRFVFALGLLVPVGYGLNSAQWITLYAAKFGSDFASRGWTIFNDRMNQAFLNNPAERVARPQAPELTNLAAYMMVVAACDWSYERAYANKRINAWLVKSSAEAATPLDMTAASFADARTFFNQGDIVVSFGEFDANLHKEERGNVKPYCGELVIHSGDAVEDGAEIMQEYYYAIVYLMYINSVGQLATHGENLAQRYFTLPGANPNAPLPPANFRSQLAQELTTDVEAAIGRAVTAQAASGTWAMQRAAMNSLGWGGAGIWYNKIAQINGSLVEATSNVPSPRRWPAVMEYTRLEQLQQNESLPVPFRQNNSNGQQVQMPSATEQAIGKTLSDVYQYFYNEATRGDRISGQTQPTNNIFIDVINMIFGTRGLFNMCQNADVHPLAQLSVLGKGLVEASIRNIGISMGAGIFGAATASMPFLGAALGAASSMLMSVATITITMGFILFYVLPFMPFLYFFFAVGGWVKGLFEAMVGVPLWALAHLRIDGDGLPGDAAMDGYYLIFEIFLRPLLILFGLLASVVIFAAMVKVLNQIFSLVVSNLSGHDEQVTTGCGNTLAPGGGGAAGGNVTGFFRGPVDELFFTIIYAIIVYMIGLSCFKLIDLVPNNLMRYMGRNLNTFNDKASDPAEGLMQRVSIGGAAINSQVLGGGGIFSSGVSALGNAGRGVAELATPPTPPAR